MQKAHRSQRRAFGVLAEGENVKPLQRKTSDVARPDVDGAVGRFAWEKVLMASALKPMARLAGLVLAAHMNGRGDVGRCWPSLATVAAEMGCARSTAASAVSALVKAGFLVRESEGGGTRSDGRGITTTYVAVAPVNCPASRTVVDEQPSGSASQPSGSASQPSGSPDRNSPQNSPEEHEEEDAREPGPELQARSEALMPRCYEKLGWSRADWFGTAADRGAVQALAVYLASHSEDEALALLDDRTADVDPARYLLTAFTHPKPRRRAVSGRRRRRGISGRPGPREPFEAGGVVAF